MRTERVIKHFTKRPQFVLLIGVFLLGAAAVAVPFHSAQSSSLSQPSSAPSMPAGASKIVGSSRESNLKSRLPGLFTFLSPVSSSASTTVDTFASDCSTAKTVFNVQDTDKTVCAQVAGAMAGWEVIWSNANFVAVQATTLTSANQSVNFTLNANSSLGDWRVIVFDPFGGTVQAVTSFTVIDSGNPIADLEINDGGVGSDPAAGSQAVFTLQLTNNGPSTAVNAQFTDAVPANTTFVSFTQLSGPVFSCISPNAGATGTTTCTIAALAKGDTATFLATYLVDTGAATGTEISNTASISSDTADNNSLNNSSSATETVVAAPCVLTPPSNIDVNADSGQAGAVVTYSAPTSTGDCGQATVGESGETIPAISCSPASGSFFPVGTTTVICSAQTGTVATFQVTVENPGGLSISLNGSNPFAVECGSDFTDPGATSVDGTGQSVPVTTTYPQGFNPAAPAVGSYTVTYTATEGQNSVSTTRTVNVADTQPPAITVNGANPYRIIQGSCSPFVDPGATANDGCAGPEPVSSSISGPNGLTSVDNNTPGTYTVTYIATDGTHQATATRSVVVGQFNQDESDQPAVPTQPPTITLNGDSQIFIECGTTFTDPGATATVCGGPVQVTTSGTVDIHTPGSYTITYTATANNLTTTADRTVTVTADNTPPVITVNGANPMTVECHTVFTDPGATANDACAGPVAVTSSGTVDPNVVGQYTITYSASDTSGHTATATRTVNVVDTTKPVVSAPSNVTVSTGPGATSCGATVSDATLGTASASDSCAGSLPVTRSGVPAGNAFPVGTTTITYSATDPSNNTGTATQLVTVLDNTPPVISCPANITVYLPLHSTATAMVVNYTAPVGTDNCAGATTTQTAGLASGSSFPVGTTTNTFRVTDASGNFTECSFTVTVLYDFTGFLSPVSNPPTFNMVKAGSAIPVKFSLSGDKGLNIFAANSPQSGLIPCDTSAPVTDLTDTVSAGGSSLSYDAGSDQYDYVWKTDSSWAGTCRQLTVTLNDGSVHVAFFKFK